MEIYQINYDASMITLIVKEKKEVYEYLKEEDDRFFMKNDDIYYQWSDDFSEKCEISNITNNRGIVQWEAH